MRLCSPGFEDEWPLCGRLFAPAGDLKTSDTFSEFSLANRFMKGIFGEQGFRKGLVHCLNSYPALHSLLLFVSSLKGLGA